MAWQTKGDVMRRLLGGTLVGLSSTLIMEYAASFLYKRESEEVRQKEEQRRKDDMPTITLVRKLASALGRQLGDESAERLGIVAHFAFGSGGGPLIVMLTRFGTDPVKAGLAVGMGMWVPVDEGLDPVAGLTAGAGAFSPVTHLRAAAAHAVYGLSGGLLVAAGARD
jgi:hypothetical protein